jgi:hypothetical protein
MSKLKIYSAQPMTGYMQDEANQIARMLVRVGNEYGFEILNPVLEEHLPDVHEPLTQVSKERLEKFWKRDKEMMQDAHIVLDYMSANKSDGVNKELGYSRFFMWKPTVRVFPKMGINISGIEDDLIHDTLVDAFAAIKQRWPDKHSLLMWRVQMLARCVPKAVMLQIKFLKDLI